MDAQNEKLIRKAQHVAQRWDLTLEQPLILRMHRVVYKVSSPWGPAALKVYSDLNAAGERAATPFYQGLPDDLGLKLYKVSPLRRAVLMEWLKGPSLQDLINDGQEDIATQHLADVASRLYETPFRNQFRFPRITRHVQQKLRNSEKSPRNTPHADNMRRTLRLMTHLIDTAPPDRVIHGDLHYRNVILTPDGPRMFDPKANRADPAYDFSKSLITTSSDAPVQELADIITRRANVFGPAVNASPKRVIQWGAITFAGRVFHGILKNLPPEDVTPRLTMFLDLAEA